MPSGKVQIQHLAHKYDLVYRDNPPKITPLYPAPEKKGKLIEFNIFHNLDVSKIRTIPLRWYKGMDYLYLSYSLIYAEISSMGTQSNKNNMPDIEFVQFKLNSDEAKEFTLWLEEHAKNYQAYFRDLLIDDHKVSMSFDARNDCFICSLTGKGEKNPNTGKTMISRSEDEQEAVMLAYYKHHVVFKKRAWKDRGSNDNWG